VSEADGGVHRRRGAGITGPRVGLGVLLAGTVVATVAVPPLITPHDRHSATPVATPSTETRASGAPVNEAPVSPAPATGPPATPARPKQSAPGACVPVDEGGVVTATRRPSCGVYRTGLGTGWTVLGDGLKILAGQVVPGSDEVAMRVERTRPAQPHTTMTLSAATPIGVTDSSLLHLRVWGGRQFGTVLRLSAVPSVRGPVTLTAPADRWTEFRVELATGSLSRITLVVAADQVPNVNRFFLDDITITG
jgi:hypothetical protein